MQFESAISKTDRLAVDRALKEMLVPQFPRSPVIIHNASFPFAVVSN
jgi:hypothetical protein